MISACFFGTLLEYPHSPVHLAIENQLARQFTMGIAMGLTAYFILTSGWGKKSGAHINPAVSMVNYRNAKISLNDLIGYVVFQTIGGVGAVYLMQMILGHALTDKPVESVVTIPYCGHPVHAFFMESVIAFILMLVVQIVSNSSWSKHTAKFAGFLVMMYVVIAGPVSGFGMNPARSFASALPARNWNSFWIYLLVPFAGMLLANEIYLLVAKNYRKETKAQFNNSMV